MNKASAKNSQPVRALFDKLSTLPKGRAAVFLGLLGASTGFAFTQVAPTQLQAALSGTPVTQAPLRHAGDPTAETVLSSHNLFLTNQIFYRKIEAIARVTDPANSPKSDSTAAAATAKTQSSPANTKAAKPTATQQAEQVTAAAPPAPKAAPVQFTGTTIDSVLEMRVAVAKDVDAIAFTTSDGGIITDLDGNQLKTLPVEQTSLATIGNGIVVAGATLPSAFWVYPENGGYVAVGNSWYRGRVLIALRDRGLIAVNHVLLGDYLYSVVGSEMSASWSLEALKAQAVAARSYALTHNIRPASEDYFDLDNTPRFQAYTGIAREANTTQAAVQATAGEFISHQGGIVESLYAASQAIVDDAHSGSGMSQLGARDMADQGYSYTEILGHYYPGTALGRLETDGE
ncbi:MAG: SpoIID/LytB domain-containing protein [Phormidesmis sp.]